MIAPEPDRAVADDRDRVARPDAGRDRGVVAGAHHVGEGEQAGHLVVADRVAHRHERAVGERHAHALALPAVGEPAEAVVAAPPAAVEARRADAVAAVDAGVVAHVERCDHEVAHLDELHVVADRLDDADELVADAVRVVGGRDAAVRPQVGAAHAGRDDLHDGVAAGREHGVGHGLDPDVAGRVDDRRKHGPSLRAWRAARDDCGVHRARHPGMRDARFARIGVASAVYARHSSGRPIGWETPMNRTPIGGNRRGIRPPARRPGTGARRAAGRRSPGTDHVEHVETGRATRAGAADVVDFDVTQTSRRSGTDRFTSDGDGLICFAGTIEVRATWTNVETGKILRLRPPRQRQATCT